MAIKGPVCGIENCRSRRYEEGEDGHLYCQNGHQQAAVVRGEDEDDYISAARTVTRKKKTVEEDDITSHKIYKGPQAFDLYLKCLQLILRHQVWFLVQSRGLPAELETVVYDLWALRIAQLEDKIASGEDPYSSSQPQSQVFSTLESGDDGTDTERGHVSGIKGKRGNMLSTAPNLNDCLLLCYLGIITLRLPLTPGDLYAWVTDDKLVYRRAIRLLPLTMRDRLPPGYRATLDPSAPPTHARFYKTLTDLQTSYEADHGIMWPPLNVPLLLFRYLKELALPLELYDATRRLGELLGYDFMPHFKGKKRLGIRHLPEAQLVSCVVVCIKVLYPFDQERRFWRSSTEQTIALMNWDVWCREMSDTKDMDSGRFTTEQMAKLSEKDVFSMGPEEMDQYLDFYADTFLDDAEIQRTKGTDDFRNALFDMFPIESEIKHPPKPTYREPSLQKELDVVKTVHSTMETVPNVAGGEGPILQAGQAYPLWKTQDDLPEAARILYEKAGRLAGLSIEMLLLSVGFTEARVEQWKRAQKRSG
jgi:RNA polymerase I-specific transcription initiation factor RRN7